MSEAGNLDSKTDDNDDIYKDIGDFHFDRELVKLEECNKAYSEDIERLSAKIKQLTERNTELQNVNDILTTNISILLKTAKAEIQRKQLVIDEFRKKIEDSNKRNYFKEDDFKNQGVCKVCKSRFSKESTNDLEEGEIMYNNSEEDDVKSEVESHRNFKSRDKREHSGNRKKRKKSHDRSRCRSNDKYSTHNHRSSRRSEDSRSHRSRSSRSRPRYKSPDERRNFSRRKTSREKASHSSDYLGKSKSQKREYFPRGKEIHLRSEERHRSYRSQVSRSRSKVNSPAPKSSAKSEKNSDNTEISCRPASASGKKDNVFRSDSTVLKNKTEEKENSKTDILKKEKIDDVKKLNKNDHHERKSGNSNDNNNEEKKCENDLYTRQSVLTDLYDETTRSKASDAKRLQNPELLSECGNDIVDCVDSSSDESWTLSFGKKPEVLSKPKTLYSRRMEIKLKQKLKEDKVNSDGKCAENNCANQEKYVDEKRICAEEEKEEGEISFENDQDDQIRDDKVQKDEACKNAKEALIPDGNNYVQDKNFAGKTCADVDVECDKPEYTITNKDSYQSFGENIIKKLLQLQKQEENSGIKEFSPLKNNYKLSKISPLKSAEKQHILEYYNLKPAQQLNNIDPEILDFSFSVPETPGKSFLNPFSVLDNQEPLRGNDDDKLKTFEEEGCVTNINSNEKDEVNKGNDANSADVEETTAGLKSENDEKDASPKGMKLRRTRAKRKLKPDAAKEKQTCCTQVNPKNKKNEDPVTYQIKTRSRSGNQTKKCTSDVNDVNEKRGRTLNKNKSVPVKRKRGAVSSEEEGEQEQERKKVNTEAEIEMKQSSNEELREKDVENEKGLNEPKAEDMNKAGDIAYFEVFQSVPESTNDASVEDKNPLEELSFSNMNDSRATNTSCSDTPTKLKCSNESKLSLLSAGNSGDSSTFKVLRSYLMLSANDESDIEAFSEDSTCSSGEYSDSGASAFVDLL